MQKLNVKLLRRIKKHILKEPRRFFMSSVIARFIDKAQWKSERKHYYDLSANPPPCGTAACIAGWANILSGKPNGSLSDAAQILGIDDIDDYELSASTRLFNAEWWPEPYCSKYGDAGGPKARTRIAAKRIEHLIKTGE